LSDSKRQYKLLYLFAFDSFDSFDSFDRKEIEKSSDDAPWFGVVAKLKQQCIRA
jgi:hypothetical protein